MAKKSVLTSVGKGTWWLLKKAAAGAYRGGKKAVKKKIPAVFTPFEVVKVISGEVEEFAYKLAKESLIIAIAGKRGSGKSSLGFKIMENIHAQEKRPCFVLGVKQSLLPSWIKEVKAINDVKNGGVVLVDEGAVTFSSRESMRKQNKDLGKILAIARHKDLTLLLVTQNTGMLDKNVLNLCDTILLKEGSLLQAEMERTVIKKLYKKATPLLKKIPAQERKSHVYVVDSDFEAILSVPLPSFWNVKISKSRA